MNEHELRDALKGVLVASSPPPPMNTEAAVQVARRAHRRRQTVLAGAGSAVAVVAIMVAAVIAPGFGGLRPGSVEPGGQGNQSIAETPRPTPTDVPAPQAPGEDTKTVWPTGPDGKPQSDRTAQAGARHEQGVKLLDELVAVVPPGYAVPPASATNPSMTTPTAGPGAQPNFWSRAHQAQFAERVDGVEVWEYLATLAVSRDGGTGQLVAQVHTPRNNIPAGLCEAAKTLWAGYSDGGLVDMGWQCQVTNVGTRQVGVVSRVDEEHSFDQWAVHRYDDGTVVFIAQAKHFADSGMGAGPLKELPLTLERLAQLAADPRFKAE